MNKLTHEQAFQVLLLQAADEERGPALFGESLERAKEAVPPFLVGESFPSVYLEHPLYGEPFLDVTVLLGAVEPGTRIASPAAGEHEAIMDWYAQTREKHEEISFGFEIDTKESVLPLSAVHFQPRTHLDFVRPFCEAVGEPQAAELYLTQAKRMPKGWPLAFFGMFRGRPGTPLRICGYLGDDEKHACATDPGHLAAVFDTIGFSAYDDTMLAQVRTLMDAAPGAIDFQFDIFPDGSVGPVFAIDVQFGIEQPRAVQASFEHGASANVMRLFEEWGTADGRWKTSVQSAFARAIPVELEGGQIGRYAFTLMPQWAKARWANGTLQPSKLYHLANGSLLD